MSQPDQKLDAIRKVAVLVATLDARVADALLDRLPEDQAAKVRLAAMDIDDVPAEQRDQIVQEFLNSGNLDADNLAAKPMPSTAAVDSGVELDDSLRQKLSAPRPSFRARLRADRAHKPCPLLAAASPLPQA